MTRAELVRRIADRSRMSRVLAGRVADSVFGCLEKGLRLGERIEIRGFGTFQVRSYKAYKGRDPRSGVAIEVKPKRLPFFKPGVPLLRKMNERLEKTHASPGLTDRSQPPREARPLQDLPGLNDSA